ncbi:hypothetical protein B0J13DRAFT_531876 [Dactylonectria estremocensis]|uniref:Uncharacterized protein n=1 Tax=Dactylonectria estremocensis TaxID=1079267 RepID=A0A9P9DMP1_9HYPO|nr:hypothetical protein B0J13DRAFT_531876 [Dactylonectria estremocensis]
MQPLPEFDPDMVLEDHAAPLDTYDSPRCYSTPIPGNRGSLDVSGQLNNAPFSDVLPHSMSMQSNNGHGPSTPGTGVGVQGSNGQHLACHFLKMDVFQFQDCDRFRLSRFHDVMQHIRRRHLLGPYSCINCRLDWPPKMAGSEQLWVEHCRIVTCQYVSFEEAGKLLPWEFKLLKPDSDLSDPEKWKWVWARLTQNRAVPKTPYRVDVANETRVVLWGKAQNFMLQFLTEQYPATIEEPGELLLRRLILAVFGDISDTTIAAGTQTYLPRPLNQPMDATSSAIGDSQTVPESNLTRQDTGQYQLPRKDPLQGLTHTGAFVEGDGLINRQSFQPQRPSRPGMKNWGSQATHEVTPYGNAFSTMPNPQRQGYSPRSRLPSLPVSVEGIYPYPGSNAAVRRNVARYPTGPPVHDITLSPHGRQTRNRS